MKQTIDVTSANRDKINILGWAGPKQTHPGFADRRYSFNLIRRNFITCCFIQKHVLRHER